ncbi:glycosyltransferase [Streptomyces shenzhenensis]|uniref:glycosyltransferase n=1 Tax=Streptomyces shenzhenensis TaxID=943815 RepID=UPI003D904056
MARIVVASTPAHGHVSPLLTAATALSARGHDVTMLTGARFESAVTAAKVAFTPLPAASDYDDRNLTECFPERTQVTAGIEQVGFDLMHIFGNPAVGQYRSLRRLVGETGATTVISDSHFFGALALKLALPEAGGPTVVALGTAPPPRYDPESRRRVRDGLTHVRDIFRSLGAPLPGDILDAMLTVPDHYLQLGVPGFEYPRDDLPPSFRFIGPMPAVPEGLHALPDWWPDLNGSRPVVVVTQGTLANTDLAALAVPAIRALAGSSALVVVVTGRPGGAADVRALVPRLPENVRLTDYFPFDLLLPHADVLVTNGGFGGVQTALRHGVPMVVAGASEDKPQVAARVAWSGTGIDLGTGRPDDEQLRTAVDKVLRTRRFRDRARQIRKELASHDAIRSLSGIVENTFRPLDRGSELSSAGTPWHASPTGRF